MLNYSCSSSAYEIELKTIISAFVFKYSRSSASIILDSDVGNSV